MANILETMITARNQARATMEQAREQLKSIEAALAQIRPVAAATAEAMARVSRAGAAAGGATAAREAARQLAEQREAVQRLANALGQVVQPGRMSAGAVQEVATAGLALGPAGIAAAGFAVSLGAIATAAAIAWRQVEALAERAEDVKNNAARTGLSARDFQGLKAGLDDALIPSTALFEATKALNQQIAVQSPLLKQLGITSRDTYGALGQVADVFRALPDGALKTSYAVDLLGRSGTLLIPILNGGSDAIRELIERAEQAGSVLKDDFIERAVLAGREMVQFNRQVQGLRDQLTLLAVPGVTTVAEKMNELVKALRSIPAAAQATGNAIRNMVDQLPTGGDAIGGQRVNDLLTLAAALKTVLDAYDRLANKDPQGVVKGKTGFGKPDDPKPAPNEDVRDEAREKRLARIQDLFRDTIKDEAALRAEAERLLTAIEKLERRKERLALTEAADEASRHVLTLRDNIEIAIDVVDRLRHPTMMGPAFIGPPSPLDSVAIGVDGKPLQRRGFAPGVSNRELERTVKKVEEIEPEIDPTLKAMLKLQESWQQTVEQTLSAAGVMSAGFNALWNGLQNGFARVVTQWRGFASAIVTIVSSLVQSILSELAKLAASWVFGAIFGALTGGLPTAALAAAGALGTGGGATTRRSEGGLVSGPGTGTSDDIPARLSNGEFVVRERSVTRETLPLLEGINRRGAAALRTFAAAPSTGSSTRPSEMLALMASVSRNLSVPPPLTAATRSRTTPDFSPPLLPPQRPAMPDFSVQRPAQAIARPAVEPSFARAAEGQPFDQRPFWERNQQSGNTYIIQTLDGRSVLLDMVSPAGAIRRANDKLLFTED